MDLLQVIDVSKQLGVGLDEEAGAGGGAGLRIGAISFSQQMGQKLAVAGATGSGKSTLLKMIAGLVQPDAGSILLEGVRVKGPLETLVAGHPGIAYLSQHFELWNNYRVGEILSYANDLEEEESGELYTVCRIDHLLQRRTDQLSGGERQRIALARLLVRPPRLLLLDEPFSNLDRVHKETLQAVVRDISARFDISCILVSHDPADLLSWADEILVLNGGRMIQKATPERIYRLPVDEYTAGLFGKYNRVGPALAARLGRLAGTGKGRDLFIRPEKLTLSAIGSTAAQGWVMGVFFFGGYYEVEVELAGSRLLVRTDTNSFQKGQGVFVGLAP
ncbi:MAG TPA: ABC transporter ATP-binding protein [Puia sp.]|jgi:ABC-type sulfate/molybdate transport systems ATPase subunit|nr:ABC transporter ATP-binding protein [Puia sp.]